MLNLSKENIKKCIYYTFVSNLNTEMPVGAEMCPRENPILHSQ